MVALLCLTLLGAAQPSPRCAPITHAGLLARLQGGQPARLVFFSSWCAPCQRHLQATSELPLWVVGAFDTPERIERVLNHLGLEGPCVMATDDLMTHLGVRRVPSVWTYRDGELTSVKDP